MAAFGLMAAACGNLDNPLEDIQGSVNPSSEDSQGSGNSSSEDIPEDVITDYEFKVTDLADNEITYNDITVLKLTNEAGADIVYTYDTEKGVYTVEKTNLASATTVWVEVTTGEPGTATARGYIQKLTADDLTALKTSKTLKMATIGDVILSNGSFAVKGTTGEQAVIAYVGKVNKYFNKFLAIALTDCGGGLVWRGYNNGTHTWLDTYPAAAAVNTYADAHPITICGTTYNTNTIGNNYYDQVADNVDVTSAARTDDAQTGWRMPSVTDWRYIFDGIGRIKNELPLIARWNDTDVVKDGATPTEPLGIGETLAYRRKGSGDQLYGVINTACGNNELKASDTYAYWTSSEYTGSDNSAWRYSFGYSRFAWNPGSISNYVRAVFAY